MLSALLFIINKRLRSGIDRTFSLVSHFFDDAYSFHFPLKLFSLKTESINALGMSNDAFEQYDLSSAKPSNKSSCPMFSFTYVGNDGLSRIASRSILSTNSSNGRSQSNVYLDNPDYYHQQQNVHHLPHQYSASTINVSLMDADPFSA